MDEEPKLAKFQLSGQTGPYLMPSGTHFVNSDGTMNHDVYKYLHLRFISEAVEEACMGFSEGGIPIGSILVKDGNIIGRGRNRRIQCGDPTAHAEIECLRNAGRLTDYRRTVLYTTLFPCTMCAGAAALFGVGLIVAGCSRGFDILMSKSLLQWRNIPVVDLNLDPCHDMMAGLIKRSPELWNEDIGALK